MEQRPPRWLTGNGSVESPYIISEEDMDLHETHAEPETNANTKEANDDGKEKVDDSVQCIICSETFPSQLTLKIFSPPPYSFAQVRRKKAGWRWTKRRPHCIGCADEAVRAWLDKTQLDSLTPAQKTEMIVNNLLDHFGIIPKLVDPKLLIADHYKFCRGCLDVNARVEAPRQPCNACQIIRRCGQCGRSSRLTKDLLRVNAHDYICVRCRDANRKKAARPAGAEPVESAEPEPLVPVEPLAPAGAPERAEPAGLGEPLVAAKWEYGIFDPRGRVAPEAPMYPLDPVSTRMAAANMATFCPLNLFPPQFGQAQAPNRPVKQQNQNPGQLGNNQGPAHGAPGGMRVVNWSQEKLDLHARGLCVWCRNPNPNLQRMGCPECLHDIRTHMRGFMAKHRG